MMSFFPLSEIERQELKQTLGALPIVGSAWPNWVKYSALGIVFVIAAQIILTLNEVGIEPLTNMGGVSLLLVFVMLLVIAYYMLQSVTTIDEKGIRQTWITKREVSWEQITFAKFVPMLASKRLVIFIAKSRPVVFQGGTQELQTAFAHISLQFKNRKL